MNRERNPTPRPGATALPLVSTGSLDAYVRTVAAIQTLSAEEERRLAIRLRDHNDIEAARRLVFSQLRFVIYIARSYEGYGLALADLIQEGNIGLMKAVRHFDPERGVRLISFAVHWIRAEIHEFILRNWRIVKLATTKAQRKLFFNLRSAKKRLGWFSRKEVDAVAKDLGVKPETVLEMERRMSSPDVSFDAPVQADEESRVFSPSAFLEAPQADPARQLEAVDLERYQKGRLRAALEKLDERSRDIVSRRWLAEKKSTLHELASRYGVSAERIRQLESGALRKMRAAVA